MFQRRDLTIEGTLGSASIWTMQTKPKTVRCLGSSRRSSLEKWAVFTGTVGYWELTVCQTKPEKQL